MMHSNFAKIILLTAASLSVMPSSARAEFQHSRSQEVSPGTVRIQIANAMAYSVENSSTYKWKESEKSANSQKATDGFLDGTPVQSFKWNNELGNANASLTSKKMVSVSAEQAGYRWGIKSGAEQTGYRWGIKSDAEQTGYRWGIK